MAFSIEKHTVTAVTRILKQNILWNLHKTLKQFMVLTQKQNSANILSEQILAEINREVVRNIYVTAKGAQVNTTTAIVFDLDTDSNSRWSVEKFKGLLFAIERDV